MNIEVFPDYMSTGLWDVYTRSSLSTEDIIVGGLDTVAAGLFAGLQQWHWVWEFLITEGRLRPGAVSAWAYDGARLVDALNKHYKNRHCFIYRTDLLV